MSHRELLEAVWEAVPAGAEPERFAERLAWLTGRIGPGERVLDLGCGEGAFAAELADRGALVVAVDVVEEPLRRAARAHPGLDLRRAPLDGPLPLDDAEVDVAWLGETLEHLVDPVGTLNELRRVLSPGGRLLVTTPDHPPELLRTLAGDPVAFAEHFSPRADHLRFFNERSLRELLEDLGYAVAELRSDGVTLYADARR